MAKREEALAIIEALGLPRGQRNERSALTLLALANIGPDGRWTGAEQPLLRIWDIRAFMRDVYGKEYAANSRETIRRQTIHQFEQARIVDRNPDDPGRPTNSGKNVYALTDDVLPVLKAYGTKRFDGQVERFIEKHGELQKAFARKRRLREIELRLPDGVEVHLSPGKHNRLQVAVIQQFGPRFAPGSRVLYVGDTAKKHVVCDNKVLRKLHIPITEHDKLPDVVLYDPKRKWLYLVEAVTSHGPVNPKRHAELEAMLADCPAHKVYVTAFLNKADFRKAAAEIPWETEVWIAESADHMIHFNGPKFLGPYRPRGK
jgi:adenine-specific DNA-methyltransferase